MDIDEKEARIVLGAINVSDFEQGEDPESQKLVARIRKEYPEIDREIIIRERKNVIWSVLAEKDQRVITARKKIGRNYEDPNFENRMDEFFRIKKIVNRELLDKEGIA